MTTVEIITGRPGQIQYNVSTETHYCLIWADSIPHAVALAKQRFNLTRDDIKGITIHRKREDNE